MITNPIALSTCCCSRKHTDGYEMLVEMADMGFEYVELSHGIRISLVPGIIRAVKEGVIKVISVHNFCPLPPGFHQAAPNIYQPTSLDDAERRQWLRQTMKTLDFAHDMGAKYCVCHLGSVHFFWGGVEGKLENYLDKYEPEDPFKDERYQKLLAKVLAKLSKKKKRHMEHLKASIDALLPYAEEKGIVLGFENRDGMEELPMDEDMPKIQEMYEGNPNVGFWYDPGHAQEKFFAGVCTPEENLKVNGPYLAGVHFQDCTAEGKAHKGIGEGVIDFDPIFEYLKPHTACILELSPRVKKEAILRSKKFLEMRLDK